MWRGLEAEDVPLAEDLYRDVFSSGSEEQSGRKFDNLAPDL